MRKETVKIKVDASCLSCQKSFMDESDDEKIFCEVDGKEVEDDFDCPDWECNFDVFNFCGFEVEGAERVETTFDDKNINLAKAMKIIK